jgi:transposase InsO family protein
MNTRGPCSARSFSPQATFGQVPVSAVQQALRQQFGLWGLPGCLRVDNGVPWGNWNDLPTPFALWIMGLGIGWHWNDPHCPQQNPKIERSQGTGKRWSEPGSCDSVAELQRHLDEADRIQREEYPSCAGRPRRQVFPQLRHSGRCYTRAWEERTWSLLRVEEQLAEYVAIRRVAATGHVSVYDHGRYVGAQYRGQSVQVQYDPQAHGWVISDSEGREIRRHEAPEISREQITKLSFRKPRKKK